MSLVINIPIEIAKQLVSAWLEIPDLCRLEVALCSPENHMSMLDIYQDVVVKCEQLGGSKDSFQKQLDWMIVRKMRISSLKIAHAIDKSTRLISLLSSSKNSVKRLDFYTSSEALSTLMVALNKYCSQLEIIEMGHCHLPVSFTQLLANSKHLAELQLSDCTGLDASHLDNLVLSSVRALRCHGDFTREFQIALLRACPNATSYSREEGEIADLSSVPDSLEKLYLFDCDTVGPVQLPKCLRNIWMKECNVTDQLFNLVIKQCPNLTVIDLQGSNALHGGCLAQIAQRYSETLTQLNVSNCPSLDQVALVDLCAKCKILVHLDMGENPQFTASVYEDVLNSCPSLRELLLQDMNISDAALGRIAAAPLEYLYLNDARGYSEAGIAALMDGCASLKQLVLYDKRVNSMVKFLWKRKRPDLNLNWSHGFGF